MTQVAPLGGTPFASLESAVVFCASCQAPIGTGAQFCASCGASTASVPTQAYAPTQAAYAHPPQSPSRAAAPSPADFAVIAATVVLAPGFIRIFNFVRFVIALIGVSFIVRAIVHFEHVRGTPAMGFATLGIFLSFIGAFVFVGIASWLGVVPGLARKFNAFR